MLYRAGVRPIAEILRENPLAQDYVSWGAPGPGRWVTIYATDSPTAHVFIVIAGLRLDTSHDGTDVGPNRNEDGPRWRILDHIPTWAHWSVRHPPGCKVPTVAARKVDYLLIGGGLASANCARWLREEGADGEVLLVGREPDPPYNRPECSKGYLRGEETREETFFRPNEWWAEQNIELLTRTSVTALDLEAAHREAVQQGGDRVRARR